MTSYQLQQLDACRSIVGQVNESLRTAFGEDEPLALTRALDSVAKTLGEIISENPPDRVEDQQRSAAWNFHHE